MRIGKTRLQSKGNYTPCPECKEYYLQAVHMRINRKWVKIGMGCPICLRKELEGRERTMENENNEHGLINNEHLKSAIETIFTHGGRLARPTDNGSIVIATQGSIDYDELVKTYGGELIKPGNGHSFNPFKDATDEQIEEFITAYCATYPEKYRDLVREKLVREIEGMRMEK